MSVTEPRGTSAVVELVGASFGYADRPVVTGLNLVIAPGEAVAIVGPNGSGKSTLVKGLVGLARQFDGSAALLGIPIDDFTDRARLGYVPQRHTLSTSVACTAREIVATGRLVCRPWWRPAGRADEDSCRRALRRVGLADRAEHEVSTLSGGQQRRVLIARALAADPDLLLMDEPTAGVDAFNQQVLARVLGDLRADRDVTLVVVTHELGALSDVITRVVVVDDGRIRWDGSIEEYARRDDLLHTHDGHHVDTDHGPTGAVPTDWRSHP